MAVEVHWNTVVFTTVFESHPPSSASIRATGPSGRFAVGLEVTSKHITAVTLAHPEARSLAVMPSHTSSLFPQVSVTCGALKVAK